MPHLFERFELLGDVVHLPGMTIDLLPTTDDFAFLDATAQAELVSAREVKPIELVDATIDRIERLNPQLNAVVTEMFESARDTALAGPLGGPFAGVPLCSRISPSSVPAFVSRRARGSCATTSRPMTRS
jgi:hypothetical protein